MLGRFSPADERASVWRVGAQAVKDFDAAIKLLETTRTVFHPYVSRGKSHRELGNLALAIKDFGVALSRRPNDIHTMMLQGQVRAADGQTLALANDETQRLLMINLGAR